MTGQLLGSLNLKVSFDRKQSGLVASSSTSSTGSTLPHNSSTFLPPRQSSFSAAYGSGFRSGYVSFWCGAGRRSLTVRLVSSHVHISLCPSLPLHLHPLTSLYLTPLYILVLSLLPRLHFALRSTLRTRRPISVSLLCFCSLSQSLSLFLYSTQLYHTPTNLSYHNDHPISLRTLRFSLSLS